MIHYFVVSMTDSST